MKNHRYLIKNRNKNPKIHPDYYKRIQEVDPYKANPESSEKEPCGAQDSCIGHCEPRACNSTDCGPCHERWQIVYRNSSVPQHMWDEFKGGKEEENKYEHEVPQGQPSRAPALQGQASHNSAPIILVPQVSANSSNGGPSSMGSNGPDTTNIPISFTHSSSTEGTASFTTLQPPPAFQLHERNGNEFWQTQIPSPTPIFQSSQSQRQDGIGNDNWTQKTNPQASEAQALCDNQVLQYIQSNPNFQQFLRNEVVKELKPQFEAEMRSRCDTLLENFKIEADEAHKSILRSEAAEHQITIARLQSKLDKQDRRSKDGVRKGSQSKDRLASKLALKLGSKFAIGMAEHSMKDLRKESPDLQKTKSESDDSTEKSKNVDDALNAIQLVPNNTMKSPQELTTSGIAILYVSNDTTDTENAPSGTTDAILEDILTITNESDLKVSSVENAVVTFPIYEPVYARRITLLQQEITELKELHRKQLREIDLQNRLLQQDLNRIEDLSLDELRFAYINLQKENASLEYNAQQADTFSAEVVSKNNKLLKEINALNDERKAQQKREIEHRTRNITISNEMKDLVGRNFQLESMLEIAERTAGGNPTITAEDDPSVDYVEERGDEPEPSQIKLESLHNHQAAFTRRPDFWGWLLFLLYLLVLGIYAQKDEFDEYPSYTLPLGLVGVVGSIVGLWTFMPAATDVEGADARNGLLSSWLFLIQWLIHAILDWIALGKLDFTHRLARSSSNRVDSFPLYTTLNRIPTPFRLGATILAMALIFGGKS